VGYVFSVFPTQAWLYIFSPCITRQPMSSVYETRKYRLFTEKRLFQVKEKTIAARRSAIKTLIFPSANKRDFDELASNVKEGLEVHFVDTYSEIYDLAFQSDSGTETS